MLPFPMGIFAPPTPLFLGGGGGSHKSLLELSFIDKINSIFMFEVLYLIDYSHAPGEPCKLLTLLLQHQKGGRPHLLSIMYQFLSQ